MKALAAVLLFALFAVSAGAAVGLVDEPRWAEGGLCVDVASFEAAAVAVVSETQGAVLVAWERDQHEPIFDPGCEGTNLVLLNPGTEGAEHRVVWVPVPCFPPEGLAVDDFAPRTLVILDEHFDTAMSFYMGPFQNGEVPCAAAPSGVVP